MLKYVFGMKEKTDWDMQGVESSGLKIGFRADN